MNFMLLSALMMQMRWVNDLKKAAMMMQMCWKLCGFSFFFLSKNSLDKLIMIIISEYAASDVCIMNSIFHLSFIESLRKDVKLERITEYSFN